MVLWACCQSENVIGSQIWLEFISFPPFFPQCQADTVPIVAMEPMLWSQRREFSEEVLSRGQAVTKLGMGSALTMERLPLNMYAPASV